VRFRITIAVLLLVGATSSRAQLSKCGERLVNPIEGLRSIGITAIHRRFLASLGFRPEQSVNLYGHYWLTRVEGPNVARFTNDPSHLWAVTQDAEGSHDLLGFLIPVGEREFSVAAVVKPVHPSLEDEAVARLRARGAFIANSLLRHPDLRDCRPASAGHLRLVHLADVPFLDGHPAALLESVYSPHSIEAPVLLDLLRNHCNPDESFLELGSGSGGVLVWLAQRTGGPLYGVENYALAQENTRLNLEIFGLDDGRVKNYLGDGLTGFPHRVDVIVGALPMLSKRFPGGRTRNGEVQEDNPNFVDLDGEYLKRVLADLPDHLTPRGRMYLLSSLHFPDYLPENLRSRLLTTHPAHWPIEKRLHFYEIRVR